MESFPKRSKCYQISWICRFIADAADQTFQVITGIQIFPNLITKHRIFFSSSSASSLRLIFFIDQGCSTKVRRYVHPWQFCLIQNPEKRTSFLLFTYCLHSSRFRLLELSISIYFPADIWADGSHLGKCSFLRLLQIQKQCTAALMTTVIISNSKPFKILYVKMLFQAFLHSSSSKYQASRENTQIPRRLFQIIYIHTAHKERRRCR